jgi:hypothetical protein
MGTAGMGNSKLLLDRSARVAPQLSNEVPIATAQMLPERRPYHISEDWPHALHKNADGRACTGVTCSAAVSLPA